MQLVSYWDNIKMSLLNRYFWMATVLTICTMMLVYVLIHQRVQEMEENMPAETDVNHVPYEEFFYDYDDYDEMFQDDLYDDSDSDEDDSNEDDSNEDDYGSYEDYEAILTDEEEDMLDSRMEDRRDWARSACEKLGEDLNAEPKGWEYLINYDYQLIWCNVFKAASTVWLTNFLTLAGYKIDDYKEYSPVQLARMIYHRPTGDELLEAHSSPDSIAFIIVRHPFTRLSSAYRDKIQNGDLNDAYGELAEKIVNDYRVREPRVLDRTLLHNSTPTFEEFVRYILDERSHNRTLDVHWIPQSEFCTPCQMDFDIILKMETLEEDQRFLLYTAAIEDLISPSFMNSGSEKRVEHGKNTTDLIEQHYSQLSLTQLKALHELYKYDFEIFNYTADEYYDMVTGD